MIKFKMLLSLVILLYGVGVVVQMEIRKFVFEFQVQEEMPIGTVVGQIPIKSGFTYRFNESIEEFNLNENTGVIVTAKMIDRESLVIDHFELIIISSPPTYTIEVHISIIDINDNEPHFPQPIINLQFSECANRGMSVLLETAEDMDIGQNDVTTLYKIIEGNESGYFNVKMTTKPSGKDPFLYLETTGELNRESKHNHSIKISAQDGGNPPKFGYLTANIEIICNNDNLSIFAHNDYLISLNESIYNQALDNTYQISLLESIPVNTRFFALHTTDQEKTENSQIEYEILGGTEKFGIFPDSYLYIKKELDREEQEFYSLTIKVSHETQNRFYNVTVAIHLIDENDNSPQFRNSIYYFTLIENAPANTFIGKVSATDEDIGQNAELTYLLPTANTYFSIDYKSGIVKSLRKFDHRENLLITTGQDYISMEVIVQDGGMPNHSNRAQINIQILDTNDNSHIIINDSYSVQISADTTIGTQVRVKRTPIKPNYLYRGQSLPQTSGTYYVQGIRIRGEIITEQTTLPPSETYYVKGIRIRGEIITEQTTLPPSEVQTPTTPIPEQSENESEDESEIEDKHDIEYKPSTSENTSEDENDEDFEPPSAKRIKLSSSSTLGNRAQGSSIQKESKTSVNYRDKSVSGQPVPNRSKTRSQIPYGNVRSHEHESRIVDADKFPTREVNDPETKATIKKYENHKCQHGEYFRIYQDLNEPTADNEDKQNDYEYEEIDDDERLGIYIPDENDEKGLCYHKVSNLYDIYKGFYSIIEEKRGNPQIEIGVINQPNPMLDRFYSTPIINPITEEDFTTISEPKVGCKHCPYKTARSQEMKRHIGSKHRRKNQNIYDIISTGKYECNLCPITTERMDNIIRHIKDQHIKKFVKYPCEQCGSTFSREYDKDSHISSGHVKPLEEVYDVLADGTIGRRPFDEEEDGKFALGKEMYQIYVFPLTNDNELTELAVGKTRFTDLLHVIEANINKMKNKPRTGCSIRKLLKLDDGDATEDEKYHVDSENAFAFSLVAVGAEAANALKFLIREILSAYYLFSPKEPKNKLRKEVPHILKEIKKKLNKLPPKAKESLETWEHNWKSNQPGTSSKRGKRSNDDCDDDGDEDEDQIEEERQLYLPPDNLKLCQKKLENLYQFDREYSSNVNRFKSKAKNVILSSKPMFFKIFASTDGVGVSQNDYTYLQDDDKFKCDYCNYETGNEIYMKRHIKERYINKFVNPFECCICKSRFKSEENRANHISKGHVRDLLSEYEIEEVYAIGDDGKIQKRPIENDDGNVYKGKTLYQIYVFPLTNDNELTELAVGKTRFTDLPIVVEGNIKNIRNYAGKGCSIRDLLKLDDKDATEDEKYQYDSENAFAFKLYIVGEKATNAFKFYIRTILKAYCVFDTNDLQLNVSDHDDDIDEAISEKLEILEEKARESFENWQIERKNA